MHIAMHYFVLMEAMASYLIHVEILMFGTHVSQFHFCRLVGKGEDGPFVATLMKKPMMPSCRI